MSTATSSTSSRTPLTKVDVLSAMPGLDSRHNWLFCGDKSATSNARSRGNDRSPSPAAAVDEAEDKGALSDSESASKDKDEDDSRATKRSRSRSPSLAGSSRGRASSRGRNRRSRSRRGRTASPVTSGSSGLKSVDAYNARARSPPAKGRLTKTQKRKAQYKRAGVRRPRNRGGRSKGVAGTDALAPAATSAPALAPFGVRDIQRPKSDTVRVSLHTTDSAVVALLTDDALMAAAGFVVERDVDAKDVYVAVGHAASYLDFTLLLANGEL